MRDIKNKLDCCIDSSSSIRDAMSNLKHTGQGIVVICNDGKVVGILTDSDIRSALLSNASIGDLCLPHVKKDYVFVYEDESREKYLKLFDQRIKNIPVLSRDHKLLRIIDKDSLSHIQNSYIIRSKAPARISLAGGGTDFTHFFMDNGGAGLSCTIAKYGYATLRLRDDSRITVYSSDFDEYVEFKNIQEVKYTGSLDIIKSVIKLMKPDCGFDLAVGCDFLPGSGLGGSAALITAVIGVFNEMKDKKLDRYAIAELAFEAERIQLSIAGGWQDQYSTVFGGFNYLEFGRENNIVHPIRVHDCLLHEFERRFFLCHTGTSHKGKSIQEINCASKTNITDNLHVGERLKRLSENMRKSLLRGNLEDVGILLAESWKIKKEKNPMVTNDLLDKIYNTAISAGSLGGRLLGTGGGGYFLFYAPPFKRFEIINSLRSLGFQPETISIDQMGLQTWKSGLKIV